MEDKLIGREKIIVWIANLINPVIAGSLFYYLWRKNFPNKARQANMIAFVVFGIYLVGYFIYKLATKSFY